MWARQLLPQTPRRRHNTVMSTVMIGAVPDRLIGPLQRWSLRASMSVGGDRRGARMTASIPQRRCESRMQKEPVP